MSSTSCARIASFATPLLVGSAFTWFSASPHCVQPALTWRAKSSRRGSGPHPSTTSYNSSGFLECSRFLVLLLNHHAVMTRPEEPEHMAIA